MSTMQMLEGLGIRDRNRVYGEAAENLKSLKFALTFDTPKKYHVTILGTCVSGYWHQY
jgi:hypothetical protein